MLPSRAGAEDGSFHEASRRKTKTASCEYAPTEGFGSVFRFCFNDGKLAQKDETRTP